MPIPFDPSFILDLADKLGLIQSVKGKLLRNPDAAADKLVLVLDELTKVYITVEAELVSYLSLYFEPQENLAEERAQLLKLEGGQLKARVAEARGHCHKIGNIYWNHLNPWFARVLDSDEQQMLQSLFMALGSADAGMISLLDGLVAWLAPQASATLDLVDGSQIDEANQHIRTARKEVATVRQTTARAVVDLRNLQADFIFASNSL